MKLGWIERPVNTHLILLILAISVSNYLTLSTWALGVGFGNGAIDLGGLLISQINNFTKVWTAHEGGIDNIGVTFYEPSAIPNGYFMLGSYCQSNIKSSARWVLVGKDATNDPSRGILKPPIDYTLVLNSASLAINQNGVAYIWQPIPPKGYTALGNVVTVSPHKPPLEKIRVVRSDFVVVEENSDWIWGVGEANSSNSFNLYASMKEGNTTSLQVPTGTFLVQQNGSTQSSVLHLIKNDDGDYSSMPNIDVIQELIQEYSPVIYFHPDEEFFPSSVSWFFENGGLLYTKGNESNPVPIDPTGSNLPQGGTNDGLYWLDLPIDDAARSAVKSGNLQGAGAYIHVKPALATTRTDIAIWIFYPFNGAAKAKFTFFNIHLGRIGEHVGDWEHVTLRISNFNRELESVFYSQHSKGEWLDGGDIEIQNGTKPVVYSSLHGHAAYPAPGTNLIGKGQIGIRNDACKGTMVMDTGVNYTLISVDYLYTPIVGPPWLDYAREWGPKISYDIADELNKAAAVLPRFLRKKFIKFLNSIPEVLGEEGPVGPKWKESWNGEELC